jgi:outer membrane protein assembly factor BamB
VHVTPRPRIAPAVLAAFLAVALAACNSGSGSGASAAPPAAAAGAPASGQAARSGPRDWTRFGYDAARTSRSPRGLSVAQVRRLRERRVRIDGTVDSSPIYVSRVPVRGRRHDLLVMTTSYGRTLGLDAATGAVLWRFTPRSYAAVKGSSQITNATPVLDPGRRYLYAASPDGQIHKLRVSSGRELTRGAWPASITRDATHEKIASALNIDGRRVLVTTGGYIGDAPPYQGKVAAIDRSSGRVVSVLNSLCVDRRSIIRPSSCSASDSAIWGRAGAVVDPVTHRIYASTGNGPFNGSTNWGDSVLELSAGVGGLLRHYTPVNQSRLNSEDADLGSSSPALLPAAGASRQTQFLLQGGKDSRLRLLDLGGSLHGVTGAAGRQLGGEAQSLPLPGGDGQLFTAPAVLHSRKQTVAFVATFSGTAAYRLAGGRLQRLWEKPTGGTSPVIAGGLLWVYDPNGGLNVYRPLSGARVRHFGAPGGHWNSPIVAGGRVYVPTGSANDHSTRGELSIFR